MKVFIADDSAILRERLTSLLLDINSVQIVGEAWDAVEAIHLIPLLQPDIVILDLHMPGGSGMKALQFIKKKLPATIVIIFTNYSYEAYKIKCLKAGADYFMDKSDDFETLPHVLKKLIKEKRAIQPIQKRE